MPRTSRLLVPLALAMLWVSGPASADWLVTRDGGRVETKGPWQVKGKQVVFTQQNGKLATLRLSDVDLDASAKATTAAAAPAAETAQPVAAEKKRPVLVLTDKDVGHVQESGEKAAPQTEDAAAAADQPAADGAVLIDTWERVATADGNGVEIFGSLKNTGKDTATDIKIGVKIFDVGGGLIATVDAAVTATVLPPNGTTNFRATFPGVLDFGSARFQVSNRALQTRPVEKPKDS